MKKRQTNIQSPDRLEALVRAAREGDQEACTALYEATAQKVYRTVRSMVRSEEQALDIQQDTYVYAFTHLDQLEEPGKFPAWLHTIAVNCTRSALRKNSPILFTELETEDGYALPEIADLSPEASPELSLERKETADYVREILEELSDGQRMLVGMYYYEQLPVGKIAEDLGVTPGTVKTQLYRSRRKIEAAVKRLEEKGVKLWGLSPLPFLVALLKRQEPAAEAGKTVLTGALTSAGIAPAAETVTLRLGRRFFETLGGKLLLGVLAAGVIGGGAAGYNWYRNNLAVPMGDVRPTETLEIRLHEDSDEDLTEPTAETEEPTTEPDTAEDLTEPTAETEEPTTEPDTAEDLTPETTEPEESTEPEETTEPANPGASASTEPKSTNATETDSGAAAQSSALISWGNDMRTMRSGVIEYKDGAPNTYGDLFLTIRGEDVPSLYSDNEAVAGVEYGNERIRNQDGSWTYCWLVRHKGIGSANIYCRLSGVSQKIAVVNNPEHTPTLIEAEWHWLGSGHQFATIRVGEWARFIAEFAWCKNAELVADQLSKLSIRQVDIDQNGMWYETAFAWVVTPNSPGTYKLYLKMGGITVGTYQLIVMEKYGTDPTDPEPTEPEPTDPAPTEPEPTNPAPTEPEPTNPAPTEPAPADPEPTDPAYEEPDPTESYSEPAFSSSQAKTRSDIACSMGMVN